MVWGTVTTCVGCLPAAQQKRCKLWQGGPSITGLELEVAEWWGLFALLLRCCGWAGLGADATHLHQSSIQLQIPGTGSGPLKNRIGKAGYVVQHITRMTEGVLSCMWLEAA